MSLQITNLETGAVALSGHVIPTQNAQFDLGNAEYKIRHLFLSDSSLWIGDGNKIDISGGNIRLRKRVANKPQATSSIDFTDYGDNMVPLNVLTERSGKPVEELFQDDDFEDEKEILENKIKNIENFLTKNHGYDSNVEY